MTRAVVAIVSSSLPVRIPIGVLAGVVVALIMACNNDGHDEDDTQFRQDVIWCEEAVAHLEECCGGAFDASQIACRHFYSKDTGCGSTDINRTDPAYTIDESKCIRSQSCDAIRGAKVCQRAQAAGSARTFNYHSNDVPVASSGTAPSSSTISSTSGSSTAGPICP